MYGYKVLWEKIIKIINLNGNLSVCVGVWV